MLRSLTARQAVTQSDVQGCRRDGRLLTTAGCCAPRCDADSAIGYSRATAASSWSASWQLTRLDRTTSTLRVTARGPP